MSKPKRELTRININLPTHMVKMLDEYADSVFVNRTTAITWLLAEGLKNQPGVLVDPICPELEV